MLDRLSPREAEVAALVADGYQNQDVGQLLGISVRTVKQHLLHIFEKLGIHNRVQLAKIFWEETAAWQAVKTAAATLPSSVHASLERKAKTEKMSRFERDYRF